MILGVIGWYKDKWICIQRFPCFSGLWQLFSASCARLSTIDSQGGCTMVTPGPISQSLRDTIKRTAILLRCSRFPDNFLLSIFHNLCGKTVIDRSQFWEYLQQFNNVGNTFNNSTITFYLNNVGSWFALGHLQRSYFMRFHGCNAVRVGDSWCLALDSFVDSILCATFWQLNLLCWKITFFFKIRFWKAIHIIHHIYGCFQFLRTPWQVCFSNELSAHLQLRRYAPVLAVRSYGRMILGDMRNLWCQRASVVFNMAMEKHHVGKSSQIISF